MNSKKLLLFLTVSATAAILTYFNTNIQTNLKIDDSFTVHTDIPLSVKAVGSSSSNPLIIFFHGGPSLPTMPFTNIIDNTLQDHAIVVHWDQRGAGKSYSETLQPEAMTLETMITDSEAVLEACLKRYKKSKAIVFGHSWGSILAAHVASRNPEKIQHYLAYGQLVNLKEATQYSYDYALKKAQESKHSLAVTQLTATHSPPQDFNELNIQRIWLTEFGGFIKGKSFQEFGELYFGTVAQNGIYTEQEAQLILSSLGFSITTLWDTLFRIDIMELASQLTMPSTFFVGEFDAAAPKSLLLPFYKNIPGPKSLIEVEDASHFILLSDPEQFQDLIINAIN